MASVLPALESTLTCPACGHVKQEAMPTDACQFFYQCERCRAVLRPKAGDCCVFCSYGSVPCPPVQLRAADAAAANAASGQPRPCLSRKPLR